MIRIGVMDEEEGYVSKLTAYLNRKNKGSVHCNAYTEADRLLTSLKGHGFSVVLSTKKELLEDIHLQKEEVCCVWLTEEEREHKDGCYCIYRYQSGTAIVEELNGILDRTGLRLQKEHRIMAVYSPVGRCGKTTMLLDHVNQQINPAWLYIGMEDYGEAEQEPADVFLYYIKERRKEKIIEQIKCCEGRIASPFSPFDSKTVNRQDMVWLVEILKQQNEYEGIVFDIGTGVIQEIEVLTVFDKVIVPYLQDEMSCRKKDHFIRLAKAYGLEEWLEQVYFLDMQNADTFATIME